MPDDLHRSVWTAYQQAGGDDRRATRATASSAFQLAVDMVLHNCPGVDARSACGEAARMIMMQPRWASDRAPRRWHCPTILTRAGRKIGATFNVVPTSPGRRHDVSSESPAS